jgi:hypothetical protein
MRIGQLSCSHRRNLCNIPAFYLPITVIAACGFSMQERRKFDEAPTYELHPVNDIGVDDLYSS